MPEQPTPADPDACPVQGGCPVPGVTWDQSAQSRARATARQKAPHSRLSPERAEQMAVRAAEQRAEARGEQRIADAFITALGRKLGYGHPLGERTGTLEFEWTPEAEARLQEVPEFCRELTRWRVEWTAHKRGLGNVIGPAEMDLKFDLWNQVSHAIQERHDGGLPWTDSAYARFARIPEFVRGQVLESIEGNARLMGATEIDDSVVDAVIQRWVDTGDFHEGRYGFS